MRMISSVPCRRWEMASERIASAVITPPALRITWASPARSPRTLKRFRRASMHATIATLRAGGIGSVPWSKPDAKDSALRKRSSVALMCLPPRSAQPGSAGLGRGIGAEAGAGRRGRIERNERAVGHALPGRHPAVGADRQGSTNDHAVTDDERRQITLFDVIQRGA